MRWLWLTLLVLSPVIFYGFALLLVAVYRGRCRRCGRRGLRTVGGYLWDGAHGGGLVRFFLCGKCGARFKQSQSDWTEPSEEEWRKHAKVVA